MINVFGNIIRESWSARSKGSGTYSIDITGIPCGLYFIELNAGEKKYYKKIVAGE